MKRRERWQSETGLALLEGINRALRIIANNFRFQPKNQTSPSEHEEALEFKEYTDRPG